MVTSRKQLRFYLQADMMNRGYFKEPLKVRLMHLLAHQDYTMECFKAMKKGQYYSHNCSHYGTIVVGNTNRIGQYATLHTSTCITDTGRRIGKGLLLSTGSMITGGEVLGNHIVVATSSVVTKSFLEGNALLVGMPAVKKVDRPDYYLLFKGESKQRVDAIETLEIKMEFE